MSAPKVWMTTSMPIRMSPLFHGFGGRLGNKIESYDIEYGGQGVSLSSLRMKAIFPLFIGLLFLKGFNQFK